MYIAADTSSNQAWKQLKGWGEIQGFWYPHFLSFWLILLLEIVIFFSFNQKVRPIYLPTPYTGILAPSLGRYQNFSYNIKAALGRKKVFFAIVMWQQWLDAGALRWTILVIIMIIIIFI